MAAKNETTECTEQKQNARAKIIYTDIILMPPMEHLMNPRVSIIIPCKDIDALTSESIDKCRQLDYDNPILQKAGGCILSSFMVGGLAK
jgi:cellulose synthase/poly-beta-1,6-N-acetylglucosamine synthase-like glycosyltransferase